MINFEFSNNKGFTQHLFGEKGAGFTLIEIVTVILVVTVGIVGVFGLAQDTASSSRLVTHELTATYLAQEGIEIVRSVRDSNWLAQRMDEETTWDENLESGIYRTDYTQLGEDDPLQTTDTDAPLETDGEGFSYSGEEESIFAREIELDNQGDQIVVTVTVSFDFGGKERTITTKEILYNWREEQ